MSDSTTLAIQFHANETLRRSAQLARVSDVFVVTGFAGTSVLARPVGTAATPAPVARLGHVRCDIGDEVVVQRVGRIWVITGVLSGDGAGSDVIYGEPILLDPVIRNKDDAGADTWDSTTGTDFSSLLLTIPDLDTATTYHISADTGAYLAAAVAGTRVRLGVRIGYPGDPNSIHPTQPWGAGHRNDTEQWCRATYERIVSGMEAIQITARAIAAVAGTNTIGDGDLRVSLVPLITTGGI